MANLKGVVTCNDDQFDTLASGGTVGTETGYDDAKLYATEVEEVTLGDHLVIDSNDRLCVDIPTPPTTDGTYTLQVVIASGVATYSWVSST